MMTSLVTPTGSHLGFHADRPAAQAQVHMSTCVHSHRNYTLVYLHDKILRYKRYKVKNWKLCFPLLTRSATPLGFSLRACKCTMQTILKLFLPLPVTQFLSLWPWLYSCQRRQELEDWKWPKETPIILHFATRFALRNSCLSAIHRYSWDLLFHPPLVPILPDFKKLQLMPTTEHTHLPCVCLACSGPLGPPIEHYHPHSYKNDGFQLTACQSH